MMSEIAGETTPLMVTIQCITYNHELYIRQCLEGFVMQKTNFRFEVIVHDDASTDGTAAIIREFVGKYPDIIKPIYEVENQYSKNDGSISRIMSEHTHGKYVAMCEGDDYWIDPLKLQKQVDFFEGNPEYGLVHTLAKKYDETKKSYSKNNIGEKFTDIDELLVANRIVTLTTCFRKYLYLDYIRDIAPQSSWKMGDYPLWLYIGFHSKIHFMDEITGVYRVMNESASHSQDIKKIVEFVLSSYSIKRMFIEKYDKDIMLKKIQKYIVQVIANSYLIQNKKVDLKILRNNGLSVNVSLKSYFLYIISCFSLTRKLYFIKNIR